jgi:hypothetical protein
MLIGTFIKELPLDEVAWLHLASPMAATHALMGTLIKPSEMLAVLH